MTNLRQAFHAFHADVYKYLFAASIVGFSYFGFVSVLLNLYLLRLGYGTDFIGLVNGGIAFAFAASSLPAGALGSRLGMRRMAATGMALLTVGMTLVPVAGSLLSGAARDVGIIAMRVLSGMGFSFYLVNAYPYLVAATGPSGADLCVRHHGRLAAADRLRRQPDLGGAAGLGRAAPRSGPDPPRPIRGRPDLRGGDPAADDSRGGTHQRSRAGSTPSAKGGGGSAGASTASVPRKARSTC